MLQSRREDDNSLSTGIGGKLVHFLEPSTRTLLKCIRPRRKGNYPHGDTKRDLVSLIVNQSELPVDEPVARFCNRLT